MIEKRNQGLKGVQYQNQDFPIIPKTVIYDFIYIAAVKHSFAADGVKEMSGYNYFTDIEFNHDACKNRRYYVRDRNKSAGL